MQTQLERELAKVPAGCKKSACTSEDGSTQAVEGPADRSEQTADIGRDPALEQKILSKIEALKERLALWTRRLEESVYLKYSYIIILYPFPPSSI